MAKPPFKRTTCDCQHCVVGCHTMPGSLVPGDLERITEYVGKPMDGDWIANHFLVSAGALVARYSRSGQATTFQVPSLVPAQQADGRCVFLGDDGHCTIHPVSPYGCAYHDSHMPAVIYKPRAAWAVEQQIQAHREGSTFTEWCALLDMLGLRAKPLPERRKDFEEEFDHVSRKQSAQSRQRALPGHDEQVAGAHD